MAVSNGMLEREREELQFLYGLSTELDKETALPMRLSIIRRTTFAILFYTLSRRPHLARLLLPLPVD